MISLSGENVHFTKGISMSPVNALMEISAEKFKTLPQSVKGASARQCLCAPCWQNQLSSELLWQQWPCLSSRGRLSLHLAERRGLVEPAPTLSARDAGLCLVHL